MIRITAAHAKLRLTSGMKEVQNSREIASPRSSFQPRRKCITPWGGTEAHPGLVTNPIGKGNKVELPVNRRMKRRPCSTGYE